MPGKLCRTCPVPPRYLELCAARSGYGRPWNGGKSQKKNFGGTYPRRKRHVKWRWPFQKGPWCNDRLKTGILDKAASNCVQYLGIAADEPNRFHVLSGVKKSPLVESGWDEADCRQWCEDNDLLSPIYTTETRGGCWFCHNQGVQQLRLLRKNYPEYWALMLKWDDDSPIIFHADGHTVHDYDRRFSLEDDGLIDPDERFRWTMLDEPLNYRLF